MGLKNLFIDIIDTTHQIDACAAALAAWHWGDSAKKSVWHWNDVISAHPFDMCC